jgi:hypothetical protein
MAALGPGGGTVNTNGTGTTNKNANSTSFDAGLNFTQAIPGMSNASGGPVSLASTIFG